MGWILVENWWPYQRPSFVTPPFAGYVSGHSVYSRAASELMTLLTGSPYFPDGLGEFECEAGEFLVFEDGPSQTIKLQWASYRDASDQTSLSRIWGGIHPGADDLPGRVLGATIGPQAWDLAVTLFNDVPCDADVTGNDSVGFDDLLATLAAWGPCTCNEDVDGDGVVGFGDVLAILANWGPC